ncbi:MAG: prolipoprotein diacylglyceryl transferase [Magnetococcales bacterium]|nr:prolipoprotein diacylglyceryl transferase [Magnetococcales bacterium]
MFPVLYSLGSLHFYTYGFSLFISLMVIYVLARRAIPGSLLTHDNLDDLMLILIGSLWLGGGLIHLMVSALNGPVNWKSLFDIHALQQFSVFPVAVATTLALVIWCRWKKLPFLAVIDFLIPFLTLGYGLHRLLGCLNAGCCYGLPTHLPWGITFPKDPFSSCPLPGIRLHPTQIYLAVLAFVTLWFLYRYKNALQTPGALSAAGLAGLSGSYFLVGFLRSDMDLTPLYLGLPSQQLLSLIVFLVTLFMCGKQWGQPAPPPLDRPSPSP